MCVLPAGVGALSSSPLLPDGKIGPYNKMPLRSFFPRDAGNLDFQFPQFEMLIINSNLKHCADQILHAAGRKQPEDRH